jgi:WD40 repeat protein
LEATLTAGVDPETIAHWRLLDFPHVTAMLTLSGHTNTANQIAWSPDGTRLATGSVDSTAKVWDEE